LPGTGPALRRGDRVGARGRRGRGGRAAGRRPGDRAARPGPGRPAGDTLTPRVRSPRGVAVCAGEVGCGRSEGVSADPQAAAALDDAALLFTHPAPDAGVLT